jgi:small subunit ribosomal protein S16
MVRIRLKRMGRTHRPFYRINAIEKREKRDGKVLENLGWYNPVETDVQRQIELKVDRIKHWLESGAQASDTVNDLLAKHGVIDAEAWKAERAGRVARKQKKMREEADRKAAEEAAAKAAEEAEAKAAEAAAAEGEEKSQG